MAPVDVSPSNEASLWQHQYVEPYIKANQKKKKKKKAKFRFKEGDTVRVSFLREPFSREYHQKWSGEVFTITGRFMRKGIPIYIVLKTTEEMKSEELSMNQNSKRLSLTRIKSLRWKRF